MESYVEVTRGDVVESRHRVHVAVAHAERGLIASAGDPQFVSFVRSAIKMFQALPLVEDGGIEAFGLSGEELALCTASHNAEPFHVDVARSLLHKAGNTEAALACGPHLPMHPGAADALLASGEAPGRIHNNCSGKHAGMLALATLHTWPTIGYHLLEHPVQQRVMRTLVDWSDMARDRLEVGNDGCGLPTFALPLERVAIACARFAAAARDGAGAAARVADAMMRHPEYVAGTGRLCTTLIRVTNGRLFAKVGAEGYYCAGVPERKLGIALKVEDGAKRASEPALVDVCRALDLLTDDDVAALDDYVRPIVANTRGETVGEIRPRIALARTPTVRSS